MSALLGGLITSGIGSIISGLGTSQNSKAISKAAKKAGQEEDKLYGRQSSALSNLTSSKEDKLKNLGNIFDRFESTGAFGDTETLKNLRKAQSDFSQLAAGDFTGFESQLRKSMSDALINTVGSGSPIGAYAGLAADTQMQYRKEGINTAVGISEFLSNESMKLLGSEFGIMDQGFEMGYKMDRDRVTNKNSFSFEQAKTKGVGTQAFGSTLTQMGSAAAGYGTYMNNLAMQQSALDSASGSVNSMQRKSFTPSGFDYSDISSGVPWSPNLPVSDSLTIIPGDPGYDSIGAESQQEVNPFSYGSGYKGPTLYPSQNSGMVLPDRQFNSAALSRVGRNIASV